VRDSGRQDARLETLANVAQTINTIHSLFLAHEEKFIVTPNYHVFEMYAAHGGGKSLRTVFTAPDIAAVKAGGPTFVYRFAPASVTRLRMSLV
jgi:alpha-L-arabinofuranosidase